AVAWAIGSPISPSAPVGLTSQPADVSVTEPTPVSFSVGYTGGPPVTVQWQRSDAGGPFNNIGGATCPTYVINPTVPSDDGARFRAVVSNAGSSATTREALLYVATDTTPPTVLWAAGG